MLSVWTVSGSFRGSDPVSPASPGSPEQSSSIPHSQFDISKALSSLDPSGYSLESDTSSSSTLRQTNPMRVLPMEILDQTALISIDVMLESPNCPTLEEDDEQKIVNIQLTPWMLLLTRRPS